jgi:small subunit ribosomal protein S1
MMNDFNNLLEEDLAGRSLSVGQVVHGTVVQISEDGVFVDIGAKSEGHLELDQVFQEELARLQVGDELRVRIIKKVDGEYKLSKKSVDYEEAWNQLIEDRNNNKVVEVKVVEKVKNGYMAEAYGLLQGFIHHTNFKGRPTIGKNYNAKILDLNRKARKLVFTRRDILKTEYEEALERDYSVLQEGMVVEGVVEKLSPYGAFIKITDNLTGLLHISEFSWDHVKKPSEVIKPGEVIQVKVLSIDREKNKISLSRKATMTDPLMLLLPGEEVDGTVESLAEFGLFVKLDNGITGLVHISELSFRKCNHPSELYKPSDPIRVKILRIQPEERRVSLSAKACERDPWSEVYSKYSIGQSVGGEVIQVLQSGLVIKLDEFFEAFVPISEISEERIKHPRDHFNEGDKAEGVILSIDSGKRRIRVSLRRTEESFAEEESKQVRIPTAAPAEDIATSAGKVTLGDILGGKLDLTSVGKKDDVAEKAPEEVAAVEETPAATEETPEAEAEESEPEQASDVEQETEPDVAEEEAAAEEPAEEDKTAAEASADAEEPEAPSEESEETEAPPEPETTEDEAAEADPIESDDSDSEGKPETKDTAAAENTAE